MFQSYSARRLMRVARFCCGLHRSNLWYREPIIGPTWLKSSLRDNSETTFETSKISSSRNSLHLHNGGHSVSRVEMWSELFYTVIMHPYAVPKTPKRSLWLHFWRRNPTFLYTAISTLKPHLRNRFSKEISCAERPQYLTCIMARNSSDSSRKESSRRESCSWENGRVFGK